MSGLRLLCEKTDTIRLSDTGTQDLRLHQHGLIRPDGEVVGDAFGLPHGYWEAKDTHDDLRLEAAKKFAAGYPSKNIVVQSPTHALLYQDGQLQLDRNTEFSLGID